MSEAKRLDRNNYIRAVWQSALLVLFACAVALTVNHFRAGGLALVGDWSVKGQLASAGRGDDMVVRLDEAELLYFSEQAVFLDARSDEVYKQGHVKGSRSLPWDDFDAKVTDVLGDTPKDAPIVTYCDGGECSLSKELALALLDRGYSNVRIFLEGYSAWQSAGLPVE